ncbi:TPA: GHMP kinase [Candidatus Poribacteria bacterium]|nr:GHMP kinase [Candidatus Poribacteria bacterium]
MLTARAPVRIDFAGGTTDISPFCDVEGGVVLNAAISRYAYASLKPREDNGISITSSDFDEFIQVRDFRELEYNGSLDLIKAAIRKLNLTSGGMDIYVRCDAPPGSGLGTSAAIGVALIALLNEMYDLRLMRREIAELEYKVEVEELGIMGGKQDQYAAALGGFNFLEFKGSHVEAHPLELKGEVLWQLEKNLVLCYTGQSRLSGDTNRKMIEGYKRGVPEVVNSLRRIKEITIEIRDKLLKGDLEGFGELLMEEYRNRRNLAPEVVTPKIEELFEVALKNGATGGKICGAGGGGCVIFYCENDLEGKVKRKLEETGGKVVEFNFSPSGVKVWWRKGGKSV